MTFLSEQEGGRQNPAFDSSAYRPNIVVGNPSQRVPITGPDGRTSTEDYLPVVFGGDGKKLTPNEAFAVELALYWTGCNYRKLTTEAEFTIREGGRIVGFGKVTKGIENVVT